MKQRRALLRAVGEAMHGHRWQMPLAKQLGIGLATLKRWHSGASGLPDDLEDRLVNVIHELVTARRQQISRLQRLAVDIMKRTSK